jgi:peptidoglycan/LPS O-acetylase OafA/YrhL
MKKQIPIEIKIVSILYYIFAVFSVIAGIMSFAGKAEIPFFALSKPMIILLGIILIGLGIFGFFVGRDLWRIKKWTRTAVIIVSGLAIVYNLILITQGSLTNNLFGIIIHIIIGGYFLFNQKIKKIFR